MTRTFQARFDGKSIVPDTPVDLPQDQRLTVTVVSTQLPELISGQQFLDAVKKVRISHEDVAAMNKAIEEGCEQVDDGG